MGLKKKMLWNICKILESKNSKKYLIELEDNLVIEIGEILHNGYIHLCISSQVGCPVNCIHCATTYSDIAFFRNITFDELNDIVDFFLNKTKAQGLPIIISFSGHGEPMLNWENVYKICDIYKNKVEDIFVTTIGIKNVMNEVLKHNFIKIFISLHGVSDKQRNKIIPNFNKNAQIKDILSFSKQYALKGGRIVWNYLMTQDNTNIKSANTLVKLLNEIDVPIEVRFTKYINIGVDNGIIPPNIYEIETFLNTINQMRNFNERKWTCRLSNIEGEDINVACGQLKASYHKGRLNK